MEGVSNKLLLCFQVLFQISMTFNPLNLAFVLKKRYRQSISTVTKIMSWFELKKDYVLVCSNSGAHVGRHTLIHLHMDSHHRGIRAKKRYCQSISIVIKSTEHVLVCSNNGACVGRHILIMFIYGLTLWAPSIGRLVATPHVVFSIISTPSVCLKNYFLHFKKNIILGLDCVFF
jgi:hypothetical protein